MANLLVTGAAGFIGTNFVRYWLEHYPEDRLVGLDALTYAGCRRNMDALRHYQQFQFIHGDIGHYENICQILREQQIDTLVHFAAESHVDRSIHGPDTFIQTNILGTHSLLKAAKTVWLDEQPGLIHRFHHVSTDEVYGSLGPEDPPFSETTPYAPNSPYSASKAASDHLVRAYHHTYGLSTTVSNCSNNYGPYQFPEKLIPLMLVNILNNKPLPVYGDGLNVRDWLYVEDHVRGIEKILSAGIVGEVYNIGGNNEWKNIDIVHLLCQEMDRAFAERSELAARYPLAPPANGQPSTSLITYVRDRLGHDRRYAINANKMAYWLNFNPDIAFASGLRKTIAWYLDNESWWRELLARAAP
ncbi:dTDP-glucose 4,6-dehydratase [Candidatus Magnetaquicoccus inordinatus]|uniref:dTDP-glucose 4,6-dehydratase n=1 Tax=Candidatus Magnetaquicoccus inordinatus TaxID=2496818 RepID=UPI00102C03E9|nr:dTDP-glucose 4,6-dehydratase [Candidatus Magnetaquicoccus inordinatus]